MLENDKNYHLTISLKDNLVIGISLMYIFRSLNIGLLDYMTIIPTHGGQGMGKEIFNFTFRKFNSIIPNGIGLLMEIQKENISDKQELIIRKNRLRFYSNLGVKFLEGVNYLLPPIYPGSKMEEMYLMIKPLGETYYLSKELVIQYIRNIYSTIYRHYGNDLIDKISSDLPEKIILRPVVI